VGNSKLQLLGWDDVTLDYQSLQLALDYQSLQLALALLEIQAGTVKNDCPHLLNFIIENMIDSRDALGISLIVKR
jgi:hypothetical protein